ncbi:hypothetical protein E2C01_044248 [Portunus trituberculatus]|uniref:Uncharacterized protein n=1 Tax=Portunus trituberculatus TaxID=210409 RepID=A0A5B7FRK9_PORTR|nr:hypothetical protein [Portunus trituberculatus]
MASLFIRLSVHPIHYRNASPTTLQTAETMRSAVFRDCGDTETRSAPRSMQTWQSRWDVCVCLSRLSPCCKLKVT